MEQRQSDDEGLLRQLTESVPLADPQVSAVINELIAEVSRLRADLGRSAGQDRGARASVESLTALLLEQASELQRERERLQRVQALIELSSWAAGTDAAGDPSIRSSDLRRALGDEQT